MHLHTHTHIYISVSVTGVCVCVFHFVTDFSLNSSTPCRANGIRKNNMKQFKNHVSKRKAGD